VGGNPAKVIRKRFSEAQIEALLKIKWWNWDIEKITENVELLTDENVDKFIDFHS
jgi:virginiamycin A acetyltransferase